MADIPDYMRDFDMDQDYGFTPVSSKPTESKPAVDPKLVENSNIEISKVKQDVSSIKSMMNEIMQIVAEKETIAKETTTEEQKKRFLPPLAKGEEVWCQLFSEPGAGSDLAGLKTKSVLEGDTWTINGQKIWTSGAHYSDFGILVTRSDPDAHKHKGLTYFFLDMKSPGVEVRPIKQISGGANFNEVYFTDVNIPDDQRLGAVGDGWKVALTTLMNERLAVGDASGPDFEEIFNLACKQDLNGDLAIKNGSVRDKLADWYCQYSGLKYTKYRNISALSRGETPGPEASITKVVSGNKLQEIANFGMDLMDSAGVIRDETTDNEQSMYQYGFFGAAGIRIAGGTDEILKNIISEQVLGLPQDMRADKGIPFNKIPTSNK